MNSRLIQFAKDGKYSITSEGNSLKATNTTISKDNRSFYSISINSNDRNHCWVNICLKWTSFYLYQDYFKDVTHKSLQNVDSWLNPCGYTTIYYLIPLKDNWKDELNLLFPVIHEFDPFDKQTVKAIYDYLNLPSPLLEAYQQRKRALARGATMGLFAHQEGHRSPTLPPEIAAEIGDYLENEGPSIARVHKAAACLGIMTPAI